MLVSVVFWKGLNLRVMNKWDFTGLNRWLEAFEKREAYLAFKFNYYKHVMDIPLQYGSGHVGGSDDDHDKFREMNLGA
jgi:glutathione S-transferase